MSEYSRFRPACSATRRISIMKSGYRSRWGTRLGLALAVAFMAAYLPAANPPGRASRASRPQPAETVEMFQAIKDGTIEVRLIPRDSKKSTVLIENKTDKPLRVQLPDAFAGVQVLAQLGGGGGLGGGGFGGGGLGGGGLGGGGLGGGGQGGGGQSFGGGFSGGGGGLGGGGFGGGGGGFGGGGGGGGFLNVRPEQVGKLKLTTVCLEHGKAEPRARMKYEIRPIAEFTDEEEVHELCRMLGARLIDQRSAQAAAWHLSNNMTWRQLASKQIRFANGMTRPYFHRVEIQRAMQAVSMARQLAQQRNSAVSHATLSRP